MRQFLRDYGLSVAIAAIFIVTWLVHSVAGWYDFAADQVQHGSTPVLWGDDGYIWRWLENTFQNWQSEFLQILILVVLTTFLIHRHGQQSSDAQDVIKAQVEEIRAMLKEQRGDA
jgi:hypothetical protein